MLRSFVVVAVGFLASLQVGCRTAVPAEASDNERVHRLLRDYTTLPQLNDHLGEGPRTCIEYAPGRQLCEWIIDNRSPAWRETAQAIATLDRVGIVCELPTSDAPRERDSCTVHQRRSNRDRWHVPVREKGRSQLREEMRTKAQALLDEARTLPAMSRLMGAAPTYCFATPPRAQTCEWRADSHVYGHGMLAASRKELMRKKMRLRCEFPLDGSARGPGTCEASVGF